MSRLLLRMPLGGLMCLALLVATTQLWAQSDLDREELRKLIRSVVEEVIAEKYPHLLATDDTSDVVATNEQTSVSVLTNAPAVIITDEVSDQFPTVGTHEVLPAVTNVVLATGTNAVMSLATNAMTLESADLVEVRLESVSSRERSWYGPRVTVGVTTIDTNEDYDFAEVSGGFDVRWPQILSFMAYGDLEMVGGLGYMRDESGQNAVLGIFGPAVTFGLFNDRVTLDIGSRPALISEDELGAHPLGGPIQFISHGAIRIHLGSHFELGGRIQHMSSAGFSDPNPGADIVAVDLLYRP